MPVDGTINLTDPTPNVVSYTASNNALSAKAQYDAWCVELGVPTTGTDVVFTGNYPFTDNSTGSGKRLAVGSGFFSAIGGVNWVSIDGYGGISFPGLYVPNDASRTTISTIQKHGVDTAKHEGFIIMAPTAQNYGYAWNGQIRTVGDTTIIHWWVGRSSWYLRYLTIRIKAGHIIFIADKGTTTNDISAITYNTETNALTGNMLTLSTGEVTKRIEFFYDQYTVSGTIAENLALNKFDVNIFNYATKYKVREMVVDTDISPNFAAYFAPPDPVLVTVTPKADIWRPNMTVSAGDIIYPTDPTITPYYHKVATAGTTGATEPAWLTSAGTLADNTVSYIWAGHMVAPVTNAPIIPQIV